MGWSPSSGFPHHLDNPGNPKTQKYIYIYIHIYIYACIIFIGLLQQRIVGVILVKILAIPAHTKCDKGNQMKPDETT